MNEEWVKIERTPAVFRHTWGDISDAIVTAVEPGSIIEFNNRTECLAIFYGGRMTCPCGLTELLSFDKAPSGERWR